MKDMNDILSMIWTEARLQFCEWSERRPEWLLHDSPLKYVDPHRALFETIQKSFLLRHFIMKHWRPVSVAELGPGACYLGFMLSSAGVYWTGYDLPGREMYDSLASAFGLYVVDLEITPDSQLNDQYDVIVATQISYMNDWTEPAFIDWLNRTRETLNESGNILLWPNPQALEGNCEEIMTKHSNDVLELPILGKGYRFEKEGKS